MHEKAPCLHLPDVEGVVWVQVSVPLAHLLHHGQVGEEISVVAVVEGHQVVLDVREPMQDFQDLEAPDDLHRFQVENLYCVVTFTKVVQQAAVEGEYSHEHGVGDKVHVAHEPVAGEGRDCLQEKIGGLAEVSDGHSVEALLHLEPVLPVPVAAFLEHLPGLGHVGLDEGVSM